MPAAGAKYRWYSDGASALPACGYRLAYINHVSCGRALGLRVEGSFQVDLTWPTQLAIAMWGVVCRAEKSKILGIGRKWWVLEIIMPNSIAL